MFLAVVAAIAGALYQPLYGAFLSNTALNGLIIAALLVGIAFIVRQVLRLKPEVTWIESYRSNQPGLSVVSAPKLLGPVATMLGERRDESVSLSTLSLRSLLDSISTRLDESRDISRYLIGLLIFLGLLGTFWGLLGTVAAIGGVISGLTIEGDDLGQVFTNLKEGLESPLSGMATAFTSSLFGLAGSLVLGFLDLQLGQAQNRFYNDLEEWLSGLTRLSGGSTILSDGEGSATAFQIALMEQTAESLDKLQRIMTRGEDDRHQLNAQMIAVNDKLSVLSDQLQNEQALLQSLINAQLELRPTLHRLADSQGAGQNEIMRTHLRNIEAYLARQIEDNANGRALALDEIRQEIRLVAKTIAASAGEDR